MGKKTEKTFVRGRRRIWGQPEAADAAAALKQICFFKIHPDSLLFPFLSPCFRYQDNPICTLHICGSDNQFCF